MAAASAVMSLVVLADAPKAKAVSLNITNAGFETPALADDAITDQSTTGGAVPGWQIYDPNGIIAGFPNAGFTDAAVGVWNVPAAAYPAEAPQGSNVGYTYLFPSTIPVGSGVVGLSQTLANALSPNTSYTLMVDVGNAQSYSVPELNLDYNLAGFGGYRVDLMAGTNILASDINSLNLAEGTFGTSTVSFTTGANNPFLGQPLAIRLTNLNQAAGTEVDFDNVRLDATAVPEPASTLGLLVLGSLGAGSAFKKKLKF